MALRFLKNKAIDRRRWNEAVSRDPGRMPYGLTWWLDAATDYHWDGFVFDDYRAVMPLPHGPWWARTRVQRPFFTQQCGPFGTVEPGDVSMFFAALPDHARSCVLPLTAFAAREEIPENYEVQSRMNFILDLERGYKQLKAGYHKDLRRKLNKYEPATLRPITAEEVLQLYQMTSGKKAGLKSKHYDRARNIMRTAMERDAAICRSLSGVNGELLAAVFMPKYQGQIINLMPASTQAGYAQDGMARLIDGVIREHAGPGQRLDFEGSDVPGIARFFGQFGPDRRPYLSVQ